MILILLPLIWCLSCKLFEIAVKCGRSLISYSESHFFHGIILILDDFAGLVDSNHVQVIKRLHAHAFLEDSSEMAF